MCSNALQCDAVCCSVMQCVAVCYSELLSAITCTCMWHMQYCVRQCVAVCCGVLQCDAMCCSVLLAHASPHSLAPVSTFTSEYEWTCRHIRDTTHERCWDWRHVAHVCVWQDVCLDSFVRVISRMCLIRTWRHERICCVSWLTRTNEHEVCLDSFVRDIRDITRTNESRHASCQTHK